MCAPRAPSAGTQLVELRQQSRKLSGVGAIWVANGTLTGDREPEQIKLGWVTHDFFSVLGARPMLGRDFKPEEEPARGSLALMLSHGLWQRRFGGDPGIVGKQVRMDGNTATVVGVMPPGFRVLFPKEANVPLDTHAWAPFPWDIARQPQDQYYLRIVGRMAPGVTRDELHQELNTIAASLRANYAPYASEKLDLNALGLRADAVRDVRPALIALIAGAILVLLIACVNIANLLLTRAAQRRREMAVRAALGATRWRLARQLLAEGLVLCAAGGVAGLLLGAWGVQLLFTLRPEALARVESSGINPYVLAYTAAVALGSGMLFGLVPAVEARRLRLTESLKQAGRGMSASRRLQPALIVSEIALGCMLLAGAGLLVRTMLQLNKVEPGFSTPGLLTFEINLPGRKYSFDAQRVEFVRAWEQRVRALPGVELAGGSSHLPLDDYPNWYSPYVPEGIPEDQARGLLADYRAITPDYLPAMRTRLIEGRHFNQHDDANAPLVVIVDDVLASATWPGESAIGKRLRVERWDQGSFVSARAEVVGVAEHVRNHSLAQKLRGQIYLPYPQSARPHLSYALLTSTDPAALVAPLRHALAQQDPEMALAKVRPMQDFVQANLSASRFTAVLAAVFALLALVLAAIGVYGVTAYSVSQRTQEIGIRMALGARPADILGMVLRQGAVWACIGVVLGIAGALALGRYLGSLLYGVTPIDPLTYLAVAVIMGTAVLLGAWRPSRRAASADPVEALRVEV
jgi:predicted permease